MLFIDTDRKLYDGCRVFSVCGGRRGQREYFSWQASQSGGQNTASRPKNVIIKNSREKCLLSLGSSPVLRRCDFFGQLQPFEINPPNSAPAFALGTSCNCKQKKYLYLKPLTTNAESYSDLPEIFTTDSSNF